MAKLGYICRQGAQCKKNWHQRIMPPFCCRKKKKENPPPRSTKHLSACDHIVHSLIEKQIMQ